LYTESKEVFFVAKQGQRYRKYTTQQRNAFIKDLEKGMSKSQLSQKHGIPGGTARTWVHRYRKTGTLEPMKRGRPPVADKDNYKLRYEILKKFMDYTKGGGKRS